MRKLKILLVILLIVGWYGALAAVVSKYGWLVGVALWGVSCIPVLISSLIMGDDEPDEHVDIELKSSCMGCKNDLGGGHCRINMERECREGGGFELWEAAEDEQSENN